MDALTHKTHGLVKSLFAFLRYRNRGDYEPAVHMLKTMMETISTMHQALVHEYESQPKQRKGI
jgi:hypothetical protein